MVVVRGRHQLDAQRQALAAQAQRALRHWQAQDVENGCKREGGIRASTEPRINRCPALPAPAGGGCHARRWAPGSCSLPTRCGQRRWCGGTVTRGHRWPEVPSAHRTYAHCAREQRHTMQHLLCHAKICFGTFLPQAPSLHYSQARQHCNATLASRSSSLRKATESPRPYPKRHSSSWVPAKPQRVPLGQGAPLPSPPRSSLPHCGQWVQTTVLKHDHNPRPMFWSSETPLCSATPAVSDRNTLGKSPRPPCGG